MTFLDVSLIAAQLLYFFVRCEKIQRLDAKTREGEHERYVRALNEEDLDFYNNDLGHANVSSLRKRLH